MHVNLTLLPSKATETRERESVSGADRPWEGPRPTEEEEGEVDEDDIEKGGAASATSQRTEQGSADTMKIDETMRRSMNGR